jgi:hypothetical protein
MKQRVRKSKGFLWIPRTVKSDIAEMDDKYEKVGPRKWIDPDYVAPEPTVEEVPVPAKEEEPIAIASATAAELLSEDDEDEG